MTTYKLKEYEDYFIKVSSVAELTRPEDCPQHHIPICRVGGGVILWVAESSLDQTEFPTEMQEGFVRVDDGPYYPCLCTPAQLWNGWACPYFTKEVMHKILSESGETVFVGAEELENETAHNYMWKINEPYADDVPDVCIYVSKDTGLHYVDGWCWDFYTPEEKKQAEDEDSAELFIGEV
jgi:hypothetical protein